MTQDSPDVKTDEAVKSSEETSKTNPPEAKPDSSKSDQGQDKPEEKVQLSKAEYEALLKDREVKDNYRKENEKLRMKGIEKKEEPRDTLVSEIPFETQQAIEMSFKKDKQEILDTLITDFSKSCSDEEWSKFSELYPAVNSHLNIALQDGKFVSKARIENSVRQYIDYAKSQSTRKSDLEKVRKDGVIEGMKAELADIGSSSSQTGKKPGNTGVSAQDLEYSKNSGGVVSPERAREIREAKEARAQEYAPRVTMNEVD